LATNESNFSACDLFQGIIKGNYDHLLWWGLKWPPQVCHSHIPVIYVYTVTDRISY